MDPGSPSTAKPDEGTWKLDSLLDVFQSVCSLELIASTYCKAEYDVHKAADILSQFQESNANGVICTHNGETGLAFRKELLQENDDINPSILRKNLKGSKPRKVSASMGTISTILGKTYTRPTSSLNGFSEMVKPLKIEVPNSLLDELEEEPIAPGIMPRKNQLPNKDVEEFLFSMLEDGFKLSMDVIKEILGDCGYDINKSIEGWLTKSAQTLDKGKAIDDGTMEKFAGKSPERESFDSKDSHFSSSSRFVEHAVDKDRSNLPRELMQSLFNAPERLEEKTQRKYLELGLNRKRAAGRSVVTKPLDDTLTPVYDISMIMSNMKDGVDDEYLALRESVKVHWDAMKSYYEAAVDAFTKGDGLQVNYFLEKGKHHNQMARETDEKSAGEFVEARENDDQAELTLNLHTHSSKEAISMLKLHLQLLASIPTFRYMKVILNTDAEDVTKGKRKRLVIKLLERESITWSEDKENPGTIFIQLDGIDPGKLNFVKGTE